MEFRDVKQLAEASTFIHSIQVIEFNVLQDPVFLPSSNTWNGHLMTQLNILNASLKTADFILKVTQRH